MTEKWVLCPICGGKTRQKMREDTEAKNLIVFCPKCKNESVVDIKESNATISKDSFIDWLKGKRYVLVNEKSDTMTEEYEKKHAWELSRNCFIDKCIRKLTENIV